MEKKLTRPAWIEINLDNFEHNINEIKNRLAPDVDILAIVKSDGYKLGSVYLVEKLLKLGIKYFGVATLSEAISIRHHHGDTNILVLGYTPEYLMEQSIAEDVMITNYSLESAIKLNEIAKRLGKKAIIHIAVDTGMRRIGFEPDKNSLKDILEISRLSNIEIDGIYTHFPSADSDPEFTKNQFETFVNFIDELEQNGVKIRHKHASNSHGILTSREYDLNMVRPGIIMYGSCDSEHDFGLSVEPIASVKAHIASVKEIEVGETVGYLRKFKAKRRTKVVTLPLGYADGFIRILSEKMNVLIDGKRCPQIGNICMDQMMIDATGVDCKEGDEVVLIGRQKSEEIKISELAKETGDVDTSFITHFNKRLPTVYLEGGKIVYIEDQVKNM